MLQKCNFLLTKSQAFDRMIHGDCEKNIFQYSAAVAQSVERRIGSAEVTGPIPVSSLDEVISSVLLDLPEVYQNLLLWLSR